MERSIADLEIAAGLPGLARNRVSGIVKLQGTVAWDGGHSFTSARPEQATRESSGYRRLRFSAFLGSTVRSRGLPGPTQRFGARLAHECRGRRPAGFGRSKNEGRLVLRVAA